MTDRALSSAGLAALPAEELKFQLDDAQEILVKEKEQLKIESDLLHVKTTMLNRLYLQRVNIFPSDTKRVTGAAPGPCDDRILPTFLLSLLSCC